MEKSKFLFIQKIIDLCVRWVSNLKTIATVMLPPKKVIYNKEIELGLFSLNDAGTIYKAVQESMDELKKYLSWSHYPCSFAQACRIYAGFEADSLNGNDYSFTGFKVDSHEFLFCVSLSRASRLNAKAFDIGYWVATEHSKKGLGTVACKMAIAIAFLYFKPDLPATSLIGLYEKLFNVHYIVL